MRLIRNLGILVLVVWICNSCFKAPEYPVIPQISYNSLYYNSGSNGDSLVLSINFKDGDGDLGLGTADSSYEYTNSYYFIINANNQFTIANRPDYKVTNGQYVTYKTKRTNSSLSIPDATTVKDWDNITVTNYLTLPDYVSPYYCTNWESKYTTVNNVSTLTDTVYKQINPNYNNIFIDFYTKNNDGSFTKFDFSSYFPATSCFPQGYNGRFPVLSQDLSKSTPLDGVIRYAMYSASSGFYLLFNNKTVKLKIYIQDRALHQSSVIETPEFTLQSIKR